MANMRTDGPDPFTQSILEGAFAAISEEMFTTLRRTSQSPLIYEVLDFATGLTDGAGRLVTQGCGVTGFLYGLGADVREALVRLGPLSPGDVVIANDPYAGGGAHLSDVTLAAPVHAQDGSLLGHAAVKAHWTEVGGSAAGSWSPGTADVYSEGLRFPWVKIAESGRPVASLVETIRANVRTPEATMGDLAAQQAVVRLAAERLTALAAQHGADAVRSGMDAILRRDRRTAEAALRALPDGTYTAQDRLDGPDGWPRPLDIRVAIRVAGGRLTMDFTGSAPTTTDGSMNCARPSLIAGARTAYRALFPPGPVSDGMFVPMDVACPPGTVFTAEAPTPVSTYWEASDAAAELAWRALAPLVPDRFPAGHSGSVCGSLLAFDGPAGLPPRIWVEPQAGGWGGGPGGDGEHALIAVGDGETLMIPAEVMEARFPLRVEELAVDTSPQGAGVGRWRGGRGLRKVMRLLAPAALTTSWGRHVTVPWGIAGGADGSPNYVEVETPDGARRRRGKWAGAPLPSGTVLRLVTGTGGGCGAPAERDPDAVADDLADGWISAPEAALAYGAPARGGRRRP